MFLSRRTSFFLMAALSIGTVVCCAGCSGESSGPSDIRPVVVGVEIAPAAAVPGEEVTLVWRFDLAEDWHLYWAGRNDSGFPPRIDLDLPEGWIAGGLQWPAPERHVAPGDILDHVYFGELVLLQKIGAPNDAAVGEQVKIKADVRWLACREMCVPGRAALTVTVPVRTRVETPGTGAASQAAARLPELLPSRALETAWEGGTFHIHHPRAQRLTFMPTEDCGHLVDLLSDGQGDRLKLRFNSKGGTVGPVRGLITIEENGGQANTYRIDFPASVLPDASPGG